MVAELMLCRHGNARRTVDADEAVVTVDVVVDVDASNEMLRLSMQNNKRLLRTCRVRLAVTIRTTRDVASVEDGMVADSDAMPVADDSSGHWQYLVFVICERHGVHSYVSHCQ